MSIQIDPETNNSKHQDQSTYTSLEAEEFTQETVDKSLSKAKLLSKASTDMRECIYTLKSETEDEKLKVDSGISLLKKLSENYLDLRDIPDDLQQYSPRNALICLEKCQNSGYQNCSQQIAESIEILNNILNTQEECAQTYISQMLKIYTKFCEANIQEDPKIQTIINSQNEHKIVQLEKLYFYLENEKGMTNKIYKTAQKNGFNVTNEVQEVIETLEMHKKQHLQQAIASSKKSDEDNINPTNIIIKSIRLFSPGIANIIQTFLEKGITKAAKNLLKKITSSFGKKDEKKPSDSQVALDTLPPIKSISTLWGATVFASYVFPVWWVGFVPPVAILLPLWLLIKRTPFSPFSSVYGETSKKGNTIACFAGENSEVKDTEYDPNINPDMQQDKTFIEERKPYDDEISSPEMDRSMDYARGFTSIEETIDPHASKQPSVPPNNTQKGTEVK